MDGGRVSGQCNGESPNETERDEEVSHKRGTERGRTTTHSSRKTSHSCWRSIRSSFFASSISIRGSLSAICAGSSNLIFMHSEAKPSDAIVVSRHVPAAAMQQTIMMRDALGVSVLSTPAIGDSTHGLSAVARSLVSKEGKALRGMASFVPFAPARLIAFAISWMHVCSEKRALLIACVCSRASFKNFIIDGLSPTHVVSMRCCTSRMFSLPARSTRITFETLSRDCERARERARERRAEKEGSSEYDRTYAGAGGEGTQRNGSGSLAAKRHATQCVKVTHRRAVRVDLAASHLEADAEVRAGRVVVHCALYLAQRNALLVPFPEAVKIGKLLLRERLPRVAARAESHDIGGFEAISVGPCA